MSSAKNTPVQAPNLRVSVALGTYNSGTFIEEQLLSILDQSYPVSEIIVTDDGSTDNTLAKIQEIAQSHPHGGCITIAFTRRVGGVSANFSRGIAATSGDIVALSDHDDRWHPDKVERAVELFAGDKSALMAFGDAVLIDGQGEHLPQSLFESYNVTEAELRAVRDGRGLDVLERRNIVTGATAVLRGDFARNSLPVGDYWIHDEWFAVLAAALGGLRVFGSPLTYYRIHGSNQIGVPDENVLQRLWAQMHASNSRYSHHVTRELALLRTAHRLGVADKASAQLYGRLRFEQARSSYGTLPLFRIKRVRKQYRAGAYKRYTLQPRLEYWGDVLGRP